MDQQAEVSSELTTNPFDLWLASFVENQQTRQRLATQLEGNESIMDRIDLSSLPEGGRLSLPDTLALLADEELQYKIGNAIVRAQIAQQERASYELMTAKTGHPSSDDPLAEALEASLLRQGPLVVIIGGLPDSSEGAVVTSDDATAAEYLKVVQNEDYLGNLIDDSRRLTGTASHSRGQKGAWLLDKKRKHALGREIISNFPFQEPAFRRLGSAAVSPNVLELSQIQKVAERLLSDIIHKTATVLVRPLPGLVDCYDHQGRGIRLAMDNNLYPQPILEGMIDSLALHKPRKQNA